MGSRAPICYMQGVEKAKKLIGMLLIARSDEIKSSWIYVDVSETETETPN